MLDIHLITKSYLTTKKRHMNGDYIPLLKSGMEGDFKIIFDLYYSPLCGYAESIICDYYAAEEIVEDVFISLWTNNKNIDIQISLKNYLYKCVRNSCLNYLKKLKTTKNKLEILNYVIEDFDILHPSSEDMPVSEMITKELESKARETMDNLPAQCREIYFLNRFENMSYSEIAIKLNISVGTVKTQMSRAFQRFRENLKEYLPLLLLLFFLK